MIFTPDAVSVLATNIQCVAINRRVAKGGPMSFDSFFGNFEETCTIGGCTDPRKIAGEEGITEAYRIEDLGTAVGLIG